MKEKYFTIVAFLLAPVLIHAQMDVATYNKDRHQLINYHTNSEGNLESVSIITEKDGKEEVTYTVVNKDGRPAEERNAPAKGETNEVMKIVNDFSNRYKYGSLDHMEIHYYTPSDGQEDWTYSREKGKLTLSKHIFTPGNGELKHPHYRVWMDYTNNVNVNVWGSVQVQLWLSPGGNILNTYIIDCRGKKADYMKGKLPHKTTGEAFYFFPDD